MYEALKEYAEEKGISVSDIVRQLILDLIQTRKYTPDILIKKEDKTFYIELKNLVKEALRETILENLGVRFPQSKVDD